MNERKFKVWCKDRYEWERDLVFLDQLGRMWHETRNNFIPLRKDNHIICWDTCKLDLTGNPIYQYNIVRITDNFKNDLGIFTVEWDEDFCRFYYKWIGNDVDEDLLMTASHNAIIIGHKFTHPELLEDK